MSVAAVDPAPSYRNRSRGCTRCLELGHYAKRCPYPDDVVATKADGNRAARQAARTAAPGPVASEALEQVAAVAAEPLTIPEQAEKLGVTVGRLYDLRQRARRAGLKVPSPKYMGPGGGDAFPRIEAEMEGETCPRCTLRGPHVCLSRADEYARSGEAAAFIGMPTRAPHRHGAM